MENNGNFRLSGNGLSGSIIGGTNNTSTTFHLQTHGEKRVIEVIVKETTIEIAYRASQLITYGYGPTRDKIWKEVYGLKDGKMTLLEIINGVHHTAYTVAESFVFDDDTSNVKTPPQS